MQPLLRDSGNVTGASMPFAYASPLARVAANSRVEDCGCWRWLCTFNNVGRPRISVRIKGRVAVITVARFIVQFIHGERWKRGRVGAHSCDNGWCVNPAHVAGSTQGRNVRDCVQRGRHVSGFKFYNEQRRQLRHLRSIANGA